LTDFSAPVQTVPGANPATVQYPLSRSLKQPGRGVKRPSTFSTAVRESAELCLFSPTSQISVRNAWSWNFM